MINIYNVVEGSIAFKLKDHSCTNCRMQITSKILYIAFVIVQDMTNGDKNKCMVH